MHLYVGVKRKKWCIWNVGSMLVITLHYITLQYITLQW